MRARAIQIAEHFEIGSRSQVLHTADRALWPELTATQRQRRNRAAHITRQPVLSSGPLLGPYTGGGAPNPSTWIRRDCPPQVAKNSYAVAVGPRNGPALDSVFTFVQRRGRVLAYFVYP